jgi:hypothetical protein
MYTGTLPAASNRADFVIQCDLVNVESTIEHDDPVNLIEGGFITVALRPLNMSTPALTGTSTDGHVTILNMNTFYVRFTREEMLRFPAGEIDIGITLKLENDGITRQLFKGQVPIIDGVVLP